ncbi:MAG: DedA family protein [Sulfurospirillaceae bacterium]|nr:DedA family protein [Sulfurospirillaceae bacterium]
MELHLLELMREYGYGILFIWSILEGESGLVMAGLFSHTGDMNLFMAIAFAGVGAFVGDQLYFYIGRYKKEFVKRKFSSHHRKIALAKALLNKYGWYIIFAQRYIYGMRTIIPLSIGLTGYSAKKFAIINFCSALCWSALIITPVWYFGEPILKMLSVLRAHWYYALPIIFLVIASLYLFIRNRTTPKE